MSTQATLVRGNRLGHCFLFVEKTKRKKNVLLTVPCDVSYFNMASRGTVDGAGCIEFTLEDLKAATDNFNSDPVHKGGCKIGEGGFGPVYRGTLKHTEVAIKLLNSGALSKEETLVTQQFETELRVLTKYRHPNLVVLLGYHNSSKCKALVYEYLPNGTLEDALETGLENHIKAKISNRIHLPWMCRISIAVDTARGLAYLHTADKRSLVHRDVKSANILLDLSFRAKVGDFGLARPLLQDESEKTHTIMGTSGYIPPEYYRGEITTKMDTYSFGVVLLEILSGLRPFDSKRDPKDLVTYMEQDMDKDIVPILCLKIDETAGSWPSDSFVKLFRIARRCVNPKTYVRPEMEEIYAELRVLMAESARLGAEIESYRKLQ